ncbi:MAG: response regulator transcription factor [Bdellovibrionota bacterium]
MNILLAEDDPHVSMIMILCLEKMGGHTVTLAEDGQAAFDAGVAAPYDLIILDGMMPKKPGVQVAKELRDAGCTTPIIYLSAKNVEAEYMNLASGYIAKPFEPTEICARIDAILGRGARVG